LDRLPEKFVSQTPGGIRIFQAGKIGPLLMDKPTAFDAA
jgi:hypothetical protein